MWSPMLPWGFPLTLLLKSKEFTTLCIDLETGSQEEWQSKPKFKPLLVSQESSYNPGSTGAHTPHGPHRMALQNSCREVNAHMVSWFALSWDPQLRSQGHSQALGLAMNNLYSMAHIPSQISTCSSPEACRGVCSVNWGAHWDSSYKTGYFRDAHSLNNLKSNWTNTRTHYAEKRILEG